MKPAPKAAAWGLALALAAAPAVGPAAPADFTHPAQQRYDIPAEPLNAALAQFATISGVDILYDHSLADGRQSSAVHGVYTPQRAIVALLRGAGLACRFTDRRAAVIFPPTPQGGPGAAAGGRVATPPAPGLSLDVMRVTAAPLIGSPDFDGYARTAQRDIYRRLETAPALQDAAFDVEIRVSLDPSGVIRQAQMMRGSGQPALDRRIVGLLEGARLSGPPPTGLPQPLRFRITSQ